MKQPDRPTQAGPDGAENQSDFNEDRDPTNEDHECTLGAPDGVIAKRIARPRKTAEDKENSQDSFIAEPGALRRRFFIAVMVPKAVTQQLGSLRDKGPDYWDWKNPGDYHISLAFPGALTTTQLDRLKTVLAQVEYPAFELRFEGLARFIKKPDQHRARSLSVLWARPEKQANAHILALHKKIAQAMTDNRFAYGRPDVVPHLTIAKAPMADNNLLEVFESAHNHVQTPPWLCAGFGLYETLERHDPQHPANNNEEGSRYRLVAHFPLKLASG